MIKLVIIKECSNNLLLQRKEKIEKNNIKKKRKNKRIKQKTKKIKNKKMCM